MPSLACQQVKEVDDTPMVPTSKDRRQESVAGPKSEEVVLSLKLMMSKTAGVGPVPDTPAARCLNRVCAHSIDDTTKASLLL